MVNPLRQLLENIKNYGGRYAIEGKDNEELDMWWQTLNVYQKKDLFEHHHLLNHEDETYLTFKELEKQVKKLKTDRKKEAAKKKPKTFNEELD